MAANDIGPRIGIDGEAEFRASINAINAQMKSLGAEMKAVTAEFAANANSQEALTAKNEVLGRSVQATKDKLALLDGQLTRQKELLASLGAELDKATAEFGKNSAAASKAQNEYNKQYAVVGNLERQYQTARGQLAGFENALNGVGEAAEEANRSLGAQDVLAGQAGWDMIQTSIRAVTGALEDAISTGMEFDASISNIAATMGTTVDSLGDLRGFAQEMGATTAFTATQAAEALNYMALAGYDAQEAMSALPNVLNLAAAGGMDLAQASDMVTDAQTALGLSMEQSAVLVDQMAQAATRTNTSVAQLGEAILTVGGTAQYMAGGTREISQVLGVLADNSIKGAEGGTKLRNIILSLSSPTEKAAKRLEELGVAVFDAEGNMREFSDIFPEMQRALSNLTSEEQITALSEIFNSRDIAAAQALLGTTVERWDELAAAIDGAEGAAQRMAETRLDNLAGDLTLLQSAADGARIALSDSLTPALRDAAQAGTGILTFVGGFVEEVLAGQALTGMTLGLGVLTAGMVASTTASAGLIASLKAASAAAVASPWGIAALAVGGLVTGLTALAHAADEAEQKTTAAAQAVADSAAAFEAQQAASREQRETIADLTGQLEELAGKEERTAGEKERLLAITEQLNQAVPGLGLSYDQLSDSLSMTTEQILELTRAQMAAQERQEAAANVVEAERAQAQAVRELSAAQEQLAAAVAARNEAEAQGMAGDLGSIETMGQLRDAVKQAEATVAELEQAVADSERQVAEMEQALEELATSSEGSADGIAQAGDAAAEAGEKAAQAAPDFETLEDATLYAAGAIDTLSAALKEQEKAGSLAYDTAQELIEAGYGAAVAIDEETGAVTLNKEEYVRLASAKIQEQIATLEAEKASLAAKAALEAEEAAARADGSAYWDAARAKAAMAHADDLQALDLQIAALNRAQQSLNSYGDASGGAARRSGSASRKIKTQAEKDLAEYKTLKDQLDHEKNMGLVEEADYYRQLTALRDQYLSDAGNIDEYRKVSETIYKADQKALENREKLWQTASDNILKLEEDFQQQLTSRAEQISNSYKLFDAVPERQLVAGTELIRNLEDQISSIEGFYTSVAQLEERGVDAALVEDIRSMGVSAAGELEGLLALTDEQLSRYSELYGEKQELANRIAMEELAGLREQTNEEILGQLDDVAQLYDANGPALGLAFANSLAEGMFEGMPAVEAMAQNVARAAMSAFSRESGNLESMMVQPRSAGVSREDIGELLAGAVNGINAGNAGAAYPTVDVTLTIDQDVLARNQVDPMRQAFREKPEVLDDKG